MAWSHPELLVAIIDTPDGFTVGTVEDGHLSAGTLVRGELGQSGVTTLEILPTGEQVVFRVEAHGLSDEHASELLRLVQE